MGVFGTPDAIFHDENHARQRCTDPAPSISIAGRSGTKTQCRMETPIKMPNAQVKGHEAPA
eukprot:scaffold25449_cov59-Phaeocystis_antarctica.AAC.1